MSRDNTFLDGNDDFRDKNLRFVRNELEDNINQFFTGAEKPIEQVPPPRDLVVQPTAGLCIKGFKINSGEKFFINICQAPEIRAPEDITDQELIDVIESPEPGSFRVAMSISEPRTTKDRSDNVVDVCDIAINPKFFAKIQKSVLFRDFFLHILGEALSEKYNIQIDMQKIVILKNRKFIGTLVAHRLRNTSPSSTSSSSELIQDVDGNTKTTDFPSIEKKVSKIIEEIDTEELRKLQKMQEEYLKQKEPIYKLRAKIREEKVDEIRAELYLPDCVSSNELNLDVGEDRILVESVKRGVIFDKFVNYNLQQHRAQALFDKTTKMLQIRIPVNNS